MWGTEEKFVQDELVRGEGEDIDGWPRTGRSHRWIKVAAAREWVETEKKELKEIMETYIDFSLKTGSRAKGEIYVRHVEWEGVLVDVRESNHESPSLVVAGWRKRGKNKTRGERWEESEGDLEETILTRRSNDVGRIRWASQKRELSGGESGTQGGESDTGIMDSTNTIMHVFEENKIDLTNITGERGQSSGENAIMQEAESDINGVDSATKQREGGVTMAREEGGEQSQGVAGEGLTPYVFLTLEELQNLRETIKKSLRELDQDRE